MIRNVIFDFDDTLTDKKTGVTNLVNEYLEDNNVSPTIIPVDFINSLYEAKDKNTEYFKSLICKYKLEETIDILDFENYYWKHSPKHFKLRNNVNKSIKKLISSGFHLGIITDGKISTQNNKINKTGINTLIENIVITDMIEENIRKPNPKIINYYLEKYDLKPYETIYIGDHPVRDIIGMKKCGLKTIWIKNERDWKHTDFYPDYIINEIDEVIEILVS